MLCKRIAAVGVASVLLSAVSLVAVPGVASASASCYERTVDPWPAWTQGRPANIDPLTAQGVYMWHDGAGWHIRVTHRSDSRQTFRGELLTTGRFVNVSAVKLEHRDALTLSANRHMITFRFNNYGHIDGLNFRTVCAPSIGFGFVSDGTRVPAEKVTIGHDGLNPPADPFVIDRA